jgi:hypothetical protein
MLVTTVSYYSKYFEVVRIESIIHSIDSTVLSLVLRTVHECDSRPARSLRATSFRVLTRKSETKRRKKLDFLLIICSHHRLHTAVR